MPSRLDIPANLEILQTTEPLLRAIRPVKSLDILSGSDNNFHPDGLYSTEIFGKSGDPMRELRCSYIDIKIPVFHPMIYRALVSLKSLYGDIIAGSKYAAWNPDLKDFERSTPNNGGRTGFYFFLQYWKQIQFQETKSDIRTETIKLVKKWEEQALTSKIVVMPAGMRDIEVDANGRMTSDEINEYYKSLISISNTVSDVAVKNNQELLDRLRYRLQITFFDLFEHLERMIDGKKKLIMGKVASRRIFNGTRNVITAMDTTAAVLGAAGEVDFNNTLIGMYQFMKATLPVSRFCIRNGFLQNVFTDVGGDVKLVDKKTLKMVPVKLRSEYYDRWMTDEGVEKVITAFGEETFRNLPLEIDGKYMGLIYKGPEGTFKIFSDIDELPPNLDRKYVTPLTFAELMYCSIYKMSNKYPLFVTRYPIAGMGSIYPSLAYLKSTTRAEKRRELGDSWEMLDDDHIAYQFPISTESFVDTLIPHSARLAGLTADFDGDTSSGNMTYSEEAKKEIYDYLQSRRAYVGPDGKITASTAVITVELVMHNLTKN